MRGQPVGGDLITLCSSGAARRKTVRRDVYVPIALDDRLSAIAKEYGVSVQRVLLLAATVADEDTVRELLACQCSRLG